MFFFQAETWLPAFPRIAGLRTEDVLLTTDDDRSTFHYSIFSCLDLAEAAFRHLPPTAATMSKAEWRSGGSFVLSGTEPYQQLVMPLVSALEHYTKTSKPRDSYYYLNADLVVPVAVIESPMVFVELNSGDPHYRLAPWVRLFRSEPTFVDALQRSGAERIAVDCVHADFLPTYIDQHLVPFAREFASLAQRHDAVLASGRGFVSGLGRGQDSAIERRLEPARIALAGPPTEIEPGFRPLLSRLLALGWEVMRTGVENLRMRSARRRRNGRDNAT